MTVDKCPVCGGGVLQTRLFGRERRYCTRSCKQAAERARAKALLAACPEAPPKPKPPPAPPWVDYETKAERQHLRECLSLEQLQRQIQRERRGRAPYRAGTMAEAAAVEKQLKGEK